uniref:NADH-ubiquinone oxidoreductase chain 3 n=1 Tax=Allopsontus sp. 2 JZ-2014 TaxID=1529457 RepID=A0A0B4N4Y3_9INSE|nr:NADH dehydrogenase subunit 3 [Allopsontus sp. 2 JZ-2014]
MNLVMTNTLMIISLTFIVMISASFLSKKPINDREKNSPFECGFDPNGLGRMPFSLRFFLIAVIFLIFDIEITLLLPLVIIYNKINVMSWITVGISFLLILLLGLYHEWNQGALKWTD